MLPKIAAIWLVASDNDFEQLSNDNMNTTITSILPSPLNTSVYLSINKSSSKGSNNNIGLENSCSSTVDIESNNSVKMQHDSLPKATMSPKQPTR